MSRTEHNLIGVIKILRDVILVRPSHFFLFGLGLVDVLGAEAPAQDDGAVLDQGVEGSAQGGVAHPSTTRTKNMNMFDFSLSMYS